MSRLTRDGTAEPISRDQILRHARGQGNIHFPCSADHEQDSQPYPVDPYSAICDDHTYIHTYIEVYRRTLISLSGRIPLSTLLVSWSDVSCQLLLAVLYGTVVAFNRTRLGLLPSRKAQAGS